MITLPRMCWIWQWIAFGPHGPLCRTRNNHLIAAQKTGDMPEIRAFDENIYLSPAMLFEYFDLLDEYGALTGKAVSLPIIHHQGKGRNISLICLIKFRKN